MPRFVLISAAAALLTLTACGNDPNKNTSVGAALLQRVKQVTSKPSTQAQAPLPGRAELTASGNPVIKVQVPSRDNAIATLSMIRQNGPTRTYLSPDGISILLQNGILSGTRGFGDDLMSSGHAGVRANVLRGAGNHSRVLRHLDDEDQLRVTRLTCTVTNQGLQPVDILGVTYATDFVVEACTGGDAPLNNIYWVAGQTIWRSGQWVSPTIGPIIIDQIK